MLEKTKIVPKSSDVTHLLTGLLGKNVTTKPGKPVDLKASQQLYWGVYTDDEETQYIGCAFDLNLAANSGAALLLFPPARAKESISKGKLEDTLEEDLQEVLNVLAQTLNTPNGPHFRFRRIVKQNGKWPAEIGRPMPTVSERLDLEVEIAGYGNGKLTMLEL